MKQLGELQNLLLTGVKLGFKGVSLFLQLNPSFLQVFERGRHVRMKDGVWDVSFNNRLYDNRVDGRVRHHETLSTSSHPPKVRLKRDRVFVSQSSIVHLVHHSTSSCEPLAITLVFLVIVEHQTLNKHLMRAVSSVIPKLSKS